MSGPASLGSVLARINQIQSQIGVGDGASSLVGAGSPATASFASALADASGAAGAVLPATTSAAAPAGGVVTAEAQPDAWAIPWAAGTKPGSGAAATKATPASLVTRGVIGSGTLSRGTLVLAAQRDDHPGLRADHLHARTAGHDQRQALRALPRRPRHRRRHGLAREVDGRGQG
ncbi:MAG: hypothetical protein U0838_06060 [Chloroflexota bacterium]